MLDARHGAGMHQADVLDGRRAWQQHGQTLAVLLLSVVFLVAAPVALWPHTANLFERMTASWNGAPTTAPTSSSTAPASAATALNADDVRAVILFADTMQPDDPLVQVRGGVFAKRSNVLGVERNGYRIFYDLSPHQSFGPLRSGKVSERDINILAQQSTGHGTITIYTLR